VREMKAGDPYAYGRRSLQLKRNAMARREFLLSQPGRDKTAVRIQAPAHSRA